MPDRTVHVLIEGRVQGVCYRAWTVQQATSRGLDGWVRNLSDGRVEAMFSGPAEKVDEMVALCRRGPSAARVDRVVEAPAVETVGRGFHQRPTV